MFCVEALEVVGDEDVAVGIIDGDVAWTSRQSRQRRAAASISATGMVVLVAGRRP